MDTDPTPSQAAGPALLPLQERDVYARAGCIIASVPPADPMGDTFVMFKSFLAAVTASGVVCEVGWGVG